MLISQVIGILSGAANVTHIKRVQKERKGHYGLIAWFFSRVKTTELNYSDKR